MTNRTNKAVEEFYSSSTIAPLLNIKAEDVQNFCYQHKIKTKVHDNGNESKLFVSSKSLQDHLARSKVSDQANIALKWQALKQSIDSKNNKRIDRKPKEKQELPTCSEMPEGFVDTKEAARMLGLHREYIRLLCKKGKLESKKAKYRYGFKHAVSINSCEDYKNKSEEMPEGFVDTKEAARMFELPLRHTVALCKRGELESKKIKCEKNPYGFKYAVNINSCKDYKNKVEEMPERFVDTKEAARMLGLSVYFIYKYINAGKLAAKKIKHQGGLKYVVSISSCEDLMEARKNIFKKSEELIEKRRKEDISIDTAYQKIKTKKEDKMNQDNNSKLPSIDLYILSHVIDLNTLALVYPGLRDWLAENENATIREFIVDTIKQMDYLSKNCKHGE